MARGAPQSQTVPSVLILGADAVFAALPATPVQLAHACARLGFASVFPASWGDELIAGACLRELADRGSEPAILCSCPRVRDLLLRAGDDLAPWMVSLVAPPVAVARYLRSAYGARVLHITYAGTCPGANDPSIDARLTPSELLALCRERGVSPAAQPQLFESIIPPDRRRSLSMPGGSPSDEALRDLPGGRTLAELSVDDPLAELADRLIAREAVLVDLAPHIGCACSGVGDAVGGRDERRQLIALEPPRSREAVVDALVDVELFLPLPSGDRPPVPRAARAPDIIAKASRPPRITLPPLITTPELSHAIIREYPRGEAPRRSASVIRRRSASETPAAQLDGVSVPRAYLAKRSPSRPERRARTAVALAARRARAERERGIDRPADLADGHRSRRTPRGSAPVDMEPPKPVPPLPGKRKPGTVLGISPIIGVALSVAAAGTLLI
jgi:hypothetical protein